MLHSPIGPQKPENGIAAPFTQAINRYYQSRKGEGGNALDAALDEAEKLPAEKQHAAAMSVFARANHGSPQETRAITMALDTIALLPLADHVPAAFSVFETSFSPEVELRAVQIMTVCAQNNGSDIQALRTALLMSENDEALCKPLRSKLAQLFGSGPENKPAAM
ncbi:MAG: hypothetical protein DI551_02555 [Micavibrio aeruginosavorus]|uniref:Uncharacterized protein n=1 Tax=Micavibrio aeruginosavorus TaxID=349221 RepID=A0A2W5N338_9BACT|nr:MAG: hypothetical protein DI551_02555 [Micavibrio aeruginosavorus]